MIYGRFHLQVSETGEPDIRKIENRDHTVRMRDFLVAYLKSLPDKTQYVETTSIPAIPGSKITRWKELAKKWRLYFQWEEELKTTVNGKTIKSKCFVRLHPDLWR